MAVRLIAPKKLLQNNGIVKFEHIRITDSGLEKGKCPTTKENIEKIAMMGRSALIPNKVNLQEA